jgi:hypothetical protein
MCREISCVLAERSSRACHQSLNAVLSCWSNCQRARSIPCRYQTANVCAYMLAKSKSGVKHKNRRGPPRRGGRGTLKQRDNTKPVVSCLCSVLSLFLRKRRGTLGSICFSRPCGASIGFPPLPRTSVLGYYRSPLPGLRGSCLEGDAELGLRGH